MSTTATTIAITSAANAQAMAANVEAQEALRKACTIYVRGYEHDRATVSEMREYAGCIERLHPVPITEEALVLAKFAMVVILGAIAAGVVWEYRERTLNYGWFGTVLWGSLVGLVVGVCGLLGLAGVWLGVGLLLS